MLRTQIRDRQEWMRGYWMIMTNAAWLEASLPVLVTGLNIIRKTRPAQARGKAAAVIALIRDRREQAERKAAEIRKRMAGQLSMFDAHKYSQLRQDAGRYESV